MEHLDRRAFLKASAATVALAMRPAAQPQHGQPVAQPAFSFAYLSDSHLHLAKRSALPVRQLLRAVEDINQLVPQPDFVLYGGDLAQLGRLEELSLGAQILALLQAPLHMMVGEHDWFYDLGAEWTELFGPAHYSFTHKGVRVVILMSVQQQDFWTARGMTPLERMRRVAGLDNGPQAAFEVGAAQREWLQRDLADVPRSTPLLVCSHSPLYNLYRPWNFWTDDAAEVQAILQPFDRVTVLHGHTHQVRSHRIGNIHFQGMPATAWPWPCSPQGLPALSTDRNDRVGHGRMIAHPNRAMQRLDTLWQWNPAPV